ncbi:MAG: oligosaccharide flippase family protein [Clostridium sp.]|nr:oligosaccharide flippase family protein [Clostridium sp.]
MKKNPLITGTILLTGAGFLSRILGFFYRIFLSRTIGAEGLGIYQMVFPIHSIAFALCCGAIQTSISRLVARDQQAGRAALRTGLFISLSISAVFSLLIWQAAPVLARFVLLEPACSPLLPIMALSIPFSSIHACICGYYYGMKRTAVPALSQMAEQLIRMGAVFLMAQVLTENGRPITVSIAVWGMMIGEAASAVYSYLVYAVSETGRREKSTDRKQKNRQLSFFHMAGPLMAMAVPLMGNRLILNCLQSLEAIFVPNRLIAFGLSHSDALSMYGVLTGMALPFIFFPSAVTNSLAVVLLPTVAEAQAQENSSQIEHTISMSLRYSLYMGIFCIGLFTLLGSELGMTVFRSKTAGQYISILAWLCPFMYISTTMGSILNGLGKTSSVFLHNAVSMLLNLAFVVFGIPQLGMRAYFYGLLLSELLLALLHLISLNKEVPVSIEPLEMIIKPCLCLATAVGLLKLCTPVLAGLEAAGMNGFLRLAGQGAVISAGYGGMLWRMHKKRSF